MVTASDRVVGPRDVCDLSPLGQVQALGSGAIGQALGDQFGNLELTSTQTAWRSSPGGRALGEFDPVLNGQLTSSRPGLFGCGISNERIRLAPCLFQLLKPKAWEAPTNPLAHHGRGACKSRPQASFGAGSRGVPGTCGQDRCSSGSLAPRRFSAPPPTAPSLLQPPPAGDQKRAHGRPYVVQPIGSARPSVSKARPR